MAILRGLGTVVLWRVVSVLGPDLGLPAPETPFFTVLRADLVPEMESSKHNLCGEEALSDWPVDSGQFLRNSLYVLSWLRRANQVIEEFSEQTGR